jgi:acyl transferase domain-containing protein
LITFADVLLSPETSTADMNDPFLSQAACAAVQIALVDLLASWDMIPTHVLGHSSGEIAAAYCAGYLSRKEAWKLAYFRGYVSTSQSNRSGGMAAVGISAQGILPYLEQFRESKTSPGELTIACYNSPKNLTISGDTEKIGLLCTALEKDGIFARKLAVRNAYHSSHMEAVADQYLELIGELSELTSEKFPTQRVEMISSVTGQMVKTGEVSNATYWVQNLVKPVLFSDALTVMVSSRESASGQRRLRVGPKSDFVSVQHIIEIGPHSALRSAIRDTLSVKKETATIAYHSLLTRNLDDIKTILTTAATLYCHCFPVSIEAVNRHFNTKSRKPKMLTDLPPYQFNHTNLYWKESRLSKNFRQRKVPRHDLFGAPVADWNPVEPRWRGFLRVCELPWLKDHKVSLKMRYPR